jgi:hypothetical protein
MSCHYFYLWRDKVPDSDPPICMAAKLRGEQGAVKRGKRAFTAFKCGCIINATRAW